MFTVKLVRNNTMRLVEAETINIYPAGLPDTEGTADNPAPLTNKIRGISVTLGGKMEVFHVGDDPSQITGDVDLYECAYIENSNGSTTERVYGQR
jgi:hypothetical protein